ncbi:MAG: tetratricopeptide repeat-containing protein [Deltaproteobacteria bacterium]|jgi:tetratricopeptide (TPR) repeat protein|nr:tetratricopeptide repeat-containing protein [Deltaproteobacteria bacterium]
MKQKIDWYQEVLTIEPGSKVFFPLARMQAENGDLEAALATLRHGLSYNSEHIEARLLFIDLLFKQGKQESIWPEVDEISHMLGGYSGFWSAWTERLAKNPQSRDAALALNFLAASLKGEVVSWSSVIEYGLERLLSGTFPAMEDAASRVDSKSRTAASAEVASRDASGFRPGRSAEIDGGTFESPDSLEKAEKFPSVEKAPDKVANAVPEKLKGLSSVPGPAGPALSVTRNKLEEEAESDLEEEEEQFSLKTRSMAEVLAEQGDYVGALDIYEDLLRAAESEDEKLSLENAIARLSADAGAATSSAVSPPGKDDRKNSARSGANRLTSIMSVLEQLAERLEAKS